MLRSDLPFLAETYPSQVKCIDISQRSVTLVIANPHRFVCEELHTLPKAPDQCYLGRRQGALNADLAVEQSKRSSHDAGERQRDRRAEQAERQ